MTILADSSGASSSAAEDRFVELFAEAFGIEKVQLLSPEHPVRDIYGGARYVDFAIRAHEQRIAFEIDGLAWHHPEAITIAKFEDGLLRQNSLVHDNWRIYRWTDRQLVEDSERVKEQLILFLGAIPGLLAIVDFLPKRITQRGTTLHSRCIEWWGRGVIVPVAWSWLLMLISTPRIRHWKRELRQHEASKSDSGFDSFTRSICSIGRMSSLV